MAAGGGGVVPGMKTNASNRRFGAAACAVEALEGRALCSVAAASDPYALTVDPKAGGLLVPELQLSQGDASPDAAAARYSKTLTFTLTTTSPSPDGTSNTLLAGEGIVSEPAGAGILNLRDSIAL